MPVADYRVSQFFNRPRLGALLELLVLHLVSVSFPGFRLFLVCPCVPIVSVVQGVRIRFFVFPIVGYPPQMAGPEVQSLGTQATGRRPDFIVTYRSSAVKQQRHQTQVLLTRAVRRRCGGR